MPDSAAATAEDRELAELLAAVKSGDRQAVVLKLRHRPELARACDRQGQTALHMAAEWNDPALGLILLQCGADPEARLGQSTHTAMSWALTCNAPEFARMLVGQGCRPDFFCAAGMGELPEVTRWFDADGNLLPGASRTGSSRVGPQGVRLPCPPDTAGEQVGDALYFASRNGHAEVVRFLLTRQSDREFRGYLGAGSLHWAHYSGSREVVALLEKAGWDPAARDATFGATPRLFGICVPASWGLEFLVRRRLAEDPTLAQFTDGSTSPLHEAARAGHAEIVELLLAAGAHRDLRNARGETALDLARALQHGAVLSLLE